MPGQDHEKRELWEDRIKNWQQSGLSQKDYCRQNNLRDNQLTYWKKRILRTEPPVSFVPVTVPDQHSSHQPLIRVTTPNGFKIETDGGIGATALQQLIAGVAAL